MSKSYRFTDERATAWSKPRPKLSVQRQRRVRDALRNEIREALEDMRPESEQVR